MSTTSDGTARMDGAMDEAPPPPPPGLSPFTPPQSHSRKQSAESLYSEITLDASPKSFSWNEKQVADEIEQVSKECNAEDAHKSSLAKPGTILTLSQVRRACPEEEEAEKLILKALDDKKDRPKMGSSILPHVPDNSASAFEATTPMEAGTSHTQQSPASPSRSKRSAGASEAPPLVGANDARQGAANTSPSLHEAVPSVHTNSASSTSNIRKRGNILGLFRRKRHTEVTQLQETSPLVSTKPSASQKVQGGDKSNEDAFILAVPAVHA